MEAFIHGGNEVLRYMAILRAARAFGLSQREIESATAGFDPRRDDCEELADALADLVLIRSGLV